MDFRSAYELHSIGSRIFTQVQALLPPGEEERNGGFLTYSWKEPANTKVIMSTTVQIGAVGHDKLAKYSAYSVEKAHRVLLTPHSTSSFESKDESNGMWPGGIRIFESFEAVAFSGLPWKHDEALVIAICLEAGVIPEEYAARIATISQNEVFWRLAEKAWGKFVAACRS